MPLLNVRLDPDDARRVAALKRAGVQLSRLVREAIRAEHERRLGGSRSRPGARVLMAEIYRDCPDPEGLPSRTYDVHDRRAAKRAVIEKLGKRRRK